MKNKFKTKLVILQILVFIFLCCNSYARTSINFSANVSAEFPTSILYNKFKSNFASSLNEVFNYASAAFSVELLSYQSIIIDEVDNFYFGGTPTMTGVKLSDDGRTDPKINESESNGGYGYFNASYGIGTSLAKNLDVFFVTGLSFPITFSFLWKFYESKTRESASKLFLFPTIGVYHSSFLGSGRSGSIGGLRISDEYSIDTGTLKIPYLYKESSAVKESIIILDVSVKYNFTYKSFNFYATAGVCFHFINHKFEFTYKNINIDYTGHGSPTGVDTNVDVTYEDKRVNIMPHISLGASFSIAKWLKWPILMCNIVYVPSIRKVVISGTIMGVALFF